MTDEELELFPTSESALKMLSYVTPGFYDKSYVGKWMFQVMGLEYDKALKLAEELPEQFFPETATWGLCWHEIKWGLPVQENLSYQERRQAIYEKRDYHSPMTPYIMERYLENATGFTVHIADCHDAGPLKYKPPHPNVFKAYWRTKRERKGRLRIMDSEKRENIKEALLARFEERVPEDFILWNFSPLSPHLWYLQALLYVLVIAFIVEHLGLRKLAYLAIPVLLAGSLIKGSYSLLFVGKEDCHIYYARNFLYCGLPFFWLGCWFGSRKEALLSFLDRKKMGFLLCGLPVFWNMAVMEQKWLEKRNALGTQEEYAGTIFLAICIFLLFIGWQNFYVENSLTRALAKVGKDYSMLIYVLHYAVLQALSRCFKGRRSLLAMGYQQYGMMFVFAVTVVMVAVYVNARACLKNHSRKL